MRYSYLKKQVVVNRFLIKPTQNLNKFLIKIKICKQQQLQLQAHLLHFVGQLPFLSI